MAYNKILEEARINQAILEKANEAAEDALYTMEDGTVKGYKAIENAVAGGYKKIENAVVSGWEKVEEACVNALFKKEGETTQEAIERLSATAATAAATEDNTMEEQRA